MVRPCAAVPLPLRAFALTVSSSFFPCKRSPTQLVQYRRTRHRRHKSQRAAAAACRSAASPASLEPSAVRSACVEPRAAASATAGTTVWRPARHATSEPGCSSDGTSTCTPSATRALRRSRHSQHGQATASCPSFKSPGDCAPPGSSCYAYQACSRYDSRASTQGYVCLCRADEAWQYQEAECSDASRAILVTRYCGCRRG